MQYSGQILETVAGINYLGFGRESWPGKYLGGLLRVWQSNDGRSGYSVIAGNDGLKKAFSIVMLKACHAEGS
jgi:hypothetical protein